MLVDGIQVGIMTSANYPELNLDLSPRNEYVNLILRRSQPCLSDVPLLTTYSTVTARCW